MKPSVIGNFELRQFDNGDFLLVLQKENLSKPLWLSISKAKMAKLRDEISNFLAVDAYLGQGVPFIRSEIVEEMWGQTLEFDEECDNEAIPLRWFSFPNKKV